DAKYASMGSSLSFLGQPIAAEERMPDGVGTLRRYEHGAIYWSPSYGAHEVHGAIWAEIVGKRWQRGLLGYPTTAESVTANGSGRYNHFEHGAVYWTPATGAHEVHGAIYDTWRAVGWENGPLGYPLSDELTSTDGVGRFSRFQSGSIYWTPATGAHEVH